MAAGRAARARLDARDATAWRVAWRALWTSRLVVLIAGALAVLSFGPQPGAQRTYDPANLTAPFGYFGNLLVSPLARWDSVWYLTIARYGYGHGGQGARTTFFPLYPMLDRGLGIVLGSDLIAGILISLVCFALALVLLYRLTALELSEEHARLCVLLLAFWPMAYYFSAVYTESLFLALSVGCVYQARLGRWGWAALLGAFAAAARNSGVLLAIPVVLLFLYGPRADTPPDGPRPDAPPAGGDSDWGGWLAGSAPGGLLERLRPRYPVRPALAWVLLVPAGLGAYLLLLLVTTGQVSSPFTQEQLWYHHFAGPFGGVWKGAVAAWDGLRQLVHGRASPVYFRQAGGDPFTVAGQNLMLFGFLLAGLIAFAGALRRLPFAYPAYALGTLALPLSYPVTPQPLQSLPRYEAVVFPLFMWGAIWVKRRAIATQTIACFAVLLGLFTAEFATWRFVA